MALTKTKFLEYTRCPRYIFLEKVKESALEEVCSAKEYFEEEKRSKLKELMDAMIEVDDEGNLIDKTFEVDKKLEAMLEYYKDVELEAGKLVSELFEGTTVYSGDTINQKYYSFLYHGVPLICYVDIYNENKKEINIIEIKATTSKKYLELSSGYPKKWKHSIFKKRGNIYFLKDELGIDIESEMPLKSYEREKAKLKDRFGLGQYFWDLAFQRFVIENALKEQKKEISVHYYLGVLNDAYTFSGKYVDGKPLYEKDEKGEELITFFHADQLTQELQKDIQNSLDELIDRLQNPQDIVCPLGSACGYKKVNGCKFFKTVCGKDIPVTNSVLNYVNNGFGFVFEDGKRLKGLELINAGYYDMLDIDEKWITKENHKIQRECYQNHTQYVNKEKIKAALDSLEYPIYHLDFETFPCPLPRFRGEHPYTQSPFEFSLHIETKPGVCDIEKDHVVFLAKTMNDEREELIKCLLEHVDVHKGTLFAQNVAFEKGRIKELASIFPKYQEDLLHLYNRSFDLLWIINNRKEFYQEKGFKGKDLETFNFYDERLSGSFSIKKTLPVFSSLSYKDLDVKNGTEAIIVYANYNRMNKEEFDKNYQALITYCTQDTWSMVLILQALRALIM